MTYDEMIDKINKINNIQGILIGILPHCSNLLFQLQKRVEKNRGFFNVVVEKYMAMRNVDTTLAIDEYIKQITSAANDYMDNFGHLKTILFRIRQTLVQV